MMELEHESNIFAPEISQITIRFTKKILFLVKDFSATGTIQRP